MDLASTVLRSDAFLETVSRTMPTFEALRILVSLSAAFGAKSNHYIDLLASKRYPNVPSRVCENMRVKRLRKITSFFGKNTSFLVTKEELVDEIRNLMGGVVRDDISPVAFEMVKSILDAEKRESGRVSECFAPWHFELDHRFIDGDDELLLDARRAKSEFVLRNFDLLEIGSCGDNKEKLTNRKFRLSDVKKVALKVHGSDFGISVAREMRARKLARGSQVSSEMYYRNLRKNKRIALDDRKKVARALRYSCFGADEIACMDLFDTFFPPPAFGVLDRVRDVEMAEALHRCVMSSEEIRKRGLDRDKRVLFMFIASNDIENVSTRVLLDLFESSQKTVLFRASTIGFSNTN